MNRQRILVEYIQRILADLDGQSDRIYVREGVAVDSDQRLFLS